MQQICLTCRYYSPQTGVSRWNPYYIRKNPICKRHAKDNRYNTPIKDTDTCDEWAMEYSKKFIKGDAMKIQKDSYIRCKSHDDMVNTKISLEEIGIESEYVEELNGKPGYWLHILKESDKK